jgi:hypothetical protein
MSEPWVADYSWFRPDPARLRQDGCIGVVRYVGPGNRGRDITAAERGALHEAGLGLCLVWETTQTGALAGRTQGAFDMSAANRWADLIGYPVDRPIFFAVDTDVTPAQVRGPIAETFHGALAHGAYRPVRPYGEADVLDILCGELGLMPCGWQCYAWSHGRTSPYRCLFQRWPPVWGGTVDHNDLGPMAVELWHPTITYGAAVAPATKDWLDMATIEDLRAVLAQQQGWHLIVDGRPGHLSAWMLNIGRMVKRWLPNTGADFPALLQGAIAAGQLPEMTDLGMRAGGDPYIGLLDLADLEGPEPPRS